jgi:hypothetical protein
MLFLSCKLVCGQDKKDTAFNYYLDENSKSLFTPEKDIKGVCFIEISDFPAVIKTNKGQEIVKLSYNDSIGGKVYYKGNHYNEGDTSSPFKPWVWVGDAENFAPEMECLDTVGKYYKVQINDTIFGFISKKDKDFEKISLSDFVLEYTGLGFEFDRKTNPLRKYPSEKSPVIMHSYQSKYRIWEGEPIKVEGDWIKVKTTTDEIGWVRWRKRKKVLIQMHFSC